MLEITLFFWKSFCWTDKWVFPQKLSISIESVSIKQLTVNTISGIQKMLKFLTYRFTQHKKTKCSNLVFGWIFKKIQAELKIKHKNENASSLAANWCIFRKQYHILSHEMHHTHKIKAEQLLQLFLIRFIF